MDNLKKVILSLVLILISTNILAQSNRQENTTLVLARKLIHTNPDSAAVLFQKKINENLKSNDTISAINALMELSTLYSHNLNYSKSYDGYWKALLLADKTKDSASIAKIYNELGWLYSFYKRDEKALEYFNRAIKIRKELIQKNPNVKEYVLSDYFSILNLHRVNKEYKQASNYLDSCRIWKNRISPNYESYYIKAEEGFLDATNGNFKESISKLNSCQKYFSKNSKTYLVVIHVLKGDVYRMMKKYDLSLEEYKSSLKLSENSKSHLNYQLKAYEGLKNIYLQKENYKVAFQYLNKETELNNKIFGLKSENSKHLIEIKDQYRIEKEKQEDALNAQLLENYEQEDKIWLLKSIILVIVIISIIFYGFILIRQIKLKHKNEKRILSEKQKLKLQKKNEVLELKNKELTQASLRHIEKDEFIAGIQKKIEGTDEALNKKVILRALKRFQGSPSKNWSEFEVRFTAINQSFYDNLKDKFPQLSQTDQKICALVRLNFASKDMARLLGISVESVHTSRYRLRKKLNLNREDNLEDFINQF
ncbi:tetratricopeptide repeat protein [Joostella atrarenae]|uniref:Tetratricopeptide repeat protein n=1 Tax=Joostella atrarenae TaxID=679257 RepID=A0ABS9J737_9FLAO|nr:tetratricopeptide repeat protein [Joostella atrarenae]MCF8716252.1 tetratricopeptide repeat protein [Joostella atrarenae]